MKVKTEFTTDEAVTIKVRSVFSQCVGVCKLEGNIRE